MKSKRVNFQEQNCTLATVGRIWNHSLLLDMEI